MTPVEPKNRNGTLPALLIAVHLTIAAPLAWVLNVWADEASTLYTTQHGLIAAFQNALADERQAPLYFWTMALWRDVNGSIFFARVFSIICCAAAIWVFCDLARRLFSRNIAIFASAFFAFHPVLIWASTEIRVYALVILLSVLILRTVWVEFFENTNGRPPDLYSYVKIAVLSTVALYTNYYLAFVLAGCFVALVVTFRWKDARRYLIASAAAGLLFLPLIFAVRSQYAVNTSAYMDAPSLFDGLRLLWHHVITFILPAGISPADDAAPMVVARLWIVRALLAAAVVMFGLRRKLPDTKITVFGIVTAAVLAGLLVAYFTIGSPFIGIRHASVLFVPLILFAASWASAVFSSDGADRRALAVPAYIGLALLGIVFFSYSLVAMFPKFAKRGDWARVGAFIAQNERPGQPIVVFTIFDSLALPYHYSGVNRIVPGDRFFDFEQEAPAGDPNSLARQTEYVISQIPADAEMLWLVENEKCMAGNACVPLEKYVFANYTIEQEQDFYLERVFLLRKKTK